MFSAENSVAFWSQNQVKQIDPPKEKFPVCSVRLRNRCLKCDRCLQEHFLKLVHMWQIAVRSAGLKSEGCVCMSFYLTVTLWVFKNTIFQLCTVNGVLVWERPRSGHLSKLQTWRRSSIFCLLQEWQPGLTLFSSYKAKYPKITFPFMVFSWEKKIAFFFNRNTKKVFSFSYLFDRWWVSTHLTCDLFLEKIRLGQHRLSHQERLLKENVAVKKNKKGGLKNLNKPKA